MSGAHLVQLPSQGRGCGFQAPCAAQCAVFKELFSLNSGLYTELQGLYEEVICY